MRTVLEEYDEMRPHFDEYCQALVRLAENLCREHGQLIHSVFGRVKARKSLENKLRRPEKRYRQLSDITDIVGLRIITYYGRDVDRIAETIRSQFAIDQKHSVDKRDVLDPDRFGYLSLHLIATLTADRLALKEYSRFRGFSAEIQIRSILQHAWAEITHDLDYKSAVEIPRDARRAFFRVAGLLELADHEFGRVRDVIADYRVSIPSRITKEPAAVFIDRDSLVEFARRSSLVIELDGAMAEAADVLEVAGGPEWIEKYVAHLEYFGVRTIAELSEALQRHRQFLMDYAAMRLVHQGYAVLLNGVSIGYLPYGFAAEKSSQEDVVEYFKRFGLYEDDNTRTEVAKLVFMLQTDRENALRYFGKPRRGGRRSLRGLS